MKRNANNNRVTNWRGRDAYTLAASRRTQSNPSFSLPSNYWENLIEKLRSVPGEEEGCFNIITELFSPNDITYGFVTTEAVSQVNTQVMDYLGQDYGSANDPEVALGIDNKDDLDVARFLYYCGFIATAITALPDKAARTPLSRDLDNMCQNYLKGQPYSPMVVTGEILIGSEYNGSNRNAEVWWTPVQAIRAVTKNDGSINDINTYLANYPNLKPIDAIGASLGNGSTGAPARTMFGVNYAAKGFKQYKNLAVRGRVIQSIDPSYLTGLGVKPIEGFGVWDLTSALTPPQPNLSNLVFQDGGISGMTCTVSGTEIIVKLTDYDAAIEYFNTHDASLVFKGPITVNGNLDSENDSKQICFKVGTNVKMSSPKSLKHKLQMLHKCPRCH